MLKSMWVVALLGSTADASVVAHKQCTKPSVRREWRTLKSHEKDQYIKAHKCLMKKPPQTSIEDVPGVRSRYDDFVATHIVNSETVHFVGIFYPYHRLLLHVYEQALHQCGWKGTIPYWDWTLDAVGPDNDTSVFFNSPIFDEDHGFGGNGAYIPGNFTHPEPGLSVNSPVDIPDRTGGGCIETGPFAGLMTNLGPGNSTAYHPQCVRRDFAPFTFSNQSGLASVQEGMNQRDFGFFDRVTEYSIHGGGHWGVGGLYGSMTNMWSSPADPLFWLHHSNMDRAWWSWQMRDIKKREHDISGPIVTFDWNNTFAGNATLDSALVVGETVQVKAKARDVMHIRKGPLCYNYDTLY